MLINMKELLEKADRGGYAVPAFNICNYAMFNGVIDTAEKLKSPVIIEIHPSELRHIGSDVTNAIRSRAIFSKVPVVLHLDHGSSFAEVMVAIRAGFTSVMIDASSLPYEKNVAICRKVVEAAHSAITYTVAEYGDNDCKEVGFDDRKTHHFVPDDLSSEVSVEGEIGNIGSIDERNGKVTEGKHFTEPEEAVRFATDTGIDTMAIAIGTCHGLYPSDYKPRLQIDRLKAIHSALRASGLNTKLVLHGGSGNPDDEVAEAARCGITKINISSDIKIAYYSEMRKVLEDKSLREPMDIEPPCIQAMQKVVEHKMKLFGSVGKAASYR